MTSPPAALAVITGAGSGVGRATAQRFAAAGWRVALLGRRREALAETAATLPPDSATLWPCDLAARTQIDAVSAALIAQLGPPAVLVNAAGTNTPQRAWGEVSAADFEAILAANLTGVFLLTRALLPALRDREGGSRVINVNSEAGRRANAKAGVAYVASKFALHGLTESLNQEENARGIRATSIFPGDINTPLLERRPVIPSATARATMLTAADVAECIFFAATRPSHVVLTELSLNASAPP